jgi:hypothetical protein
MAARGSQKATTPKSRQVQEKLNLQHHFATGRDAGGAEFQLEKAEFSVFGHNRE